MNYIDIYYNTIKIYLIRFQLYIPFLLGTDFHLLPSFPIIVSP